MKILGINTTIACAVTRRVIKLVLQHIREIDPKSFDRIFERVEVIAALDGTGGYVQPLDGLSLESSERLKVSFEITVPEWENYYEIDALTMDLVLNNDDTQMSNTVYTVAHEFGHVATRHKDTAVCSSVLSAISEAEIDEDLVLVLEALRTWVREAAANKYAWRWGFETHQRVSREIMGDPAEHVAMLSSRGMHINSEWGDVVIDSNRFGCPYEKNTQDVIRFIGMSEKLPGDEIEVQGVKLKLTENWRWITKPGSKEVNIC